jgi:hypothetical protein
MPAHDSRQPTSQPVRNALMGAARGVTESAAVGSAAIANPSSVRTRPGAVQVWPVTACEGCRIRSPQLRAVADDWVTPRA